jgi:catechol 2,3-dioxygenase-like lactoylglutathione lyase family enzyme
MVKLSNLVHMEMAVRDAEAAFGFLRESLGAQRVQEDFSGFLEANGRARVIHVGLGDIVLQFIQPLNEMGTWSELLKKGAGVHNLTFIVDDMEEVLRAMEKEGVNPLFSFPLDWAKLAGPENVRPDVPPVYMMDTMSRIGFHLELSESPFKESLSMTQLATHAPEGPIGQVSPLLHIELVTPDVEETFRFLHNVFGSEPVEEEFADFLDSPFMKIRHMNLSNVVLQYCQPLMPQLSWYELLQERGASVHNITFIVENMEKTMTAIEKAGAADLLTFPLDWGKLIGPENVKENVPPVHMVNTMDILGFHLELSERPTDKKVHFLYTDIQ